MAELCYKGGDHRLQYEKSEGSIDWYLCELCGLHVGQYVDGCRG